MHLSFERDPASRTRAGLRSAAVVAALLCSVAPAFADKPAVIIASASLVDPATALTYYGTPASPSPGARQPIVQELARALRYDVDAINAYIRDNIEYLPMFGLQAGGRGVILNGRGTAFDQAQLMVDLLREADAVQSKGYAPAYKLGKITLTAAQFAAWTGVNDAALATKLLANGGIPATVTGSGSSFTVTMLHCWVQVTIGGTNYLFDPGYKPSTVTAGLNWRGATSYSKPTLLAAAGGTQTATQVRNFNIASFRAKLNEYRGNVETFLANNAAGKRAEAVVGFSTITPHPASEDRRTSLPYVAATDRTWTGQVPDIFRTSFTVKMNGTAYGTYYADVVSGEVWSFPYVRTGSVFQPSGTPVGARVNGSPALDCNFYNSGRATVAPAIASISINHPYAANFGGYADRIIERQLNERQCSAGEFYVSNDWGFTDQGVSQRMAPAVSKIRQEQSLEYIFAPTVANVASQYSAFLDFAQDGQAGRFQTHGLIGIHTLDLLNGKWIPSPSYAEFSSDVSLSMNFEATVSAIGSAGTAVSDTTAAYTAAMALSYAEGSVPRQEADSVYDLAALNLVTEQDTRASTPGSYYNYLATPATWTSVKSSLSAYPAGSTTAMDGYVAEGYSLLAPQKGALRQPSITVSSVTTARAETREGVTLGSTAVEVDRSAFLAWRPGGSATPDRIALVMYDQRRGSVLKAGMGVPVSDPAGSPIRKPEMPKAEGKDFIRSALNVDGRSGAVTYAPAPDLIDGAGEFPKSLSLQRHYDQRDQTNYGFGMGWKHNWHQVATFSNDGQAALGRAGAQAVGGILVTIQALGDLVTTQDAQNLYAALQVASWMADQPINNSVVISRGLEDEQTFYRQADGVTYANSKPDGSTLTAAGTPQTGIINRRIYVGTSATYTDSSGAIRNYAPRTDSAGRNFAQPNIASMWTRKSYYMNNWTFPNGVKINSDFEESIFVPDIMYLKRVYNNLGSAIYLGRNPGYESGSSPVRYYCEFFGGPILVGPAVDAEMQYRTAAGVEARFIMDPQNYYMLDTGEERCPSESINPPTRRTTLLSSLRSVTDSVEKSWNYTYIDVSGMFGGSSGLSGIYKPGSVPAAVTLGYGLDSNVRTLTNLRTKAWRYYSTPFRSEVVSPEQHDAVTPIQTVDAGQGAVTYFDRYAQPIRSVDPLSRVTLTAYDDIGRPAKVTQPEGNATETEYDVRGNVVRQIQKPKPGIVPAPADLITNTGYVEGPTVKTCTNLKTCNKPAYWIDARGTRTSYDWASATGELLTVQSGLNSAGTACLLASGVCPQITVGYGSGVGSYDPLTGAAGATLYFPLTKTELIQSGVSRITTYGYDLKTYSVTYGEQMSGATVKRVVPKQILTDSGGLNLRQCYDYDLAGNIISNVEPNAGLGVCP